MVLDLIKAITSKDPVLTFYLTQQKAPLSEERTDNLIVNSCVCRLEDKEAQREKWTNKEIPSNHKKNGTDFER